ncbi:MAG: hypothetical protein ACT4PW_00205 [Acidimicrobiia bacterium]
MSARARRTIGWAAVVVAFLVAACGDEPAADRATPATDRTEATTATQATAADAADSPCGITLAEVEAQLPGTRVTENATPDPARCNFTWDDGGPRGLDVAVVPGGRAGFTVPSGFQPTEGYGDEAYRSTSEDRASAVALLGDDLYAADVAGDDGGHELIALALTFLQLSLP